MRLFVSNLPFTTSEQEVWDAFQQFGHVEEVYFVRDRTQQFRGFCFIDMPNKDAMLAIQQLHRSEWNGRRIRVEEAEDRRPRERPVAGV